MSRTPGQLLTRVERKALGLSLGEARRIERQERREGRIIADVETTEKYVGKFRKQHKAEKMEAEGRKKLAGWRRLNSWSGYETKGGVKRAKRFEGRGKDFSTELTNSERSRILAEFLKGYTGWGSEWHVAERTDISATLRNPAGDPIGTGGTVMAFATLGLSLLAHKSRRGREHDKYLNIFVHPNGMVETSGSFWHEGKDHSYMRDLTN